MNETVVTVRGRVVSEVRVKEPPNSSRIVTFRLLTTERKQENGRWVDGESSFFGVSCFGALAENVRLSVERGHPVVVIGRLRVREFTQNEQLMRSPEINATSVGHDLCLGTAKFRRPGQATMSPEEREAAEMVAEMVMEDLPAPSRELGGRPGGDEAELADVVEMSGTGAA